jgi:membrane protease YdiL (CAAX protease family)
VLAFVWSGAVWVPAALVAQGVRAAPALAGVLTGPLNPAAWGPLVAALVTTYRAAGAAGVEELLRRGVAVRFGGAWYLAVFLLFPLLIGGSLLLAALMGEPVPPSEALADPVVVPVAFLYILFLGGPLQEEFGWRGVLQDGLQRRWGVLAASPAVGFVWGVWHLPLFFIPGDTVYYDRPFWGLVLTTVLISVLFAWVYNGTDRSIFAVLLFHTMFNLSHYVFPALRSDLAGTLLWPLQLGAAVAVVFLGRWTAWPRRSETGAS